MTYNAEHLLRYTTKCTKSYLFSLQYRTFPTYFSRSPRTLTFEHTVLTVLNLIKKATAVEIMNVFKHIEAVSKNPSRQALAKARDKVHFHAFKDLFGKSCELAVNGEGAKCYKGYRLFAIDGTSFFVGLLENLKEFFGEKTTVAGRAMCRISGVVDVLNDCIVDAKVAGFETGERALAKQQIDELREVINALYLFDRGYWSPEIVRKIHDNGQKFLMRLASNVGNPDLGIPLRRVSIALPNGETEVLLTNLFDVPDEELAQLYARRWGAETKYLELKDRLEIDNLSGKSVNTVLQDIYATLYMSNLIAFMCFKADEVIEERTAGKENQYPQKANRSYGIAALREHFVSILSIENPLLRSNKLDRFIEDLSRHVVYIGKSKARPRDKRKIKTSRSLTNKKSVL